MTRSTKNPVSTIPMSIVRDEYGSGEGRHWFDKSSMRFFRSQLPRNAYRGPGGIFFVSSEQFIGSNGAQPRRYTVRQFIKETFVTQDEYKQNSSRVDIKTIGEFNVASRDEATRAAKLYAQLGVKE